jgi:hypothetical protein
MLVNDYFHNLSPENIVLIRTSVMIRAISEFCTDLHNHIIKMLLYSYYELIIDITSDIRVLGYLIDYINENTNLSHILFNGKPYYERTNPWCNKKYMPEIRPDYDKDLICNSRGVCCDYIKPVSSYTLPKNEDTIKYVVDIVKGNNKFLDLHFNKYSQYSRRAGKFIGFMSNLHNYGVHITDPSKILLVGYEKFSLKTRTSILNRVSHSGTTHCAIWLGNVPQVECNNYITLLDLMEAYYQLKSHKFCKKYELFYGVAGECINKKLNVEINLEM